MSATEKSQESAGKRSWKGPACLTLLLVGLTAIVLWGWQLRPRVPLLLTLATQAVPKERFSGPQFAWLSDNQYATFGKDNRTLCRYSLANGSRTQLLASLDSRSWCSNIQASPDGRWLHWTKCTGGPRYGSWFRIQEYFTHTDDGRTYQDAYSLWGPWEPDSRHILGLTILRESLVIFDPFANRISRTLPLASGVSSNLGNSIEVAPDRLLEISQENNTKESIEVCEYGVDKTLHLTHKWLVSPPHDTTIGTIANIRLSPTGDRIAWLVDSAQVDSGRAALHRLLPFVSVPMQLRQELWISRLDGKGMRLVGQTLLKTRSGNEVRITDLRWLPNGKRLSFSYEDALWTVSVQQ